MNIAYAAALIAFIGLLAYHLPLTPKWQELGRIAFAVGLLAALLIFGLHHR